MFVYTGRLIMENNKFLKLHSFLRYGAALIAIIVFISMFAGSEIVHSDFDNARFNWAEVYFGGDTNKATVFGFIGYLFIIIGGLASLAFVFIDELIGKDLTKKIAFACGAAMILGGIFILLTGVFFRAFNDGFGIEKFHLSAKAIVFGILGLVAGAAAFAAPILEDKGL